MSENRSHTDVLHVSAKVIHEFNLGRRTRRKTAYMGHSITEDKSDVQEWEIAHRPQPTEIKNLLFWVGLKRGLYFPSENKQL